MKKSNKLVPYSKKVHKKYQTMHQAVEDAVKQLQLPLKKATSPFRRMRRRGSQRWLGE